MEADKQMTDFVSYSKLDTEFKLCNEMRINFEMRPHPSLDEFSLWVKLWVERLPKIKNPMHSKMHRGHCLAEEAGFEPAVGY